MKAARIGVIFILFIFAFGINIPHTVYAQSCAITANNQPLTTPIASGIDVTFSADVTPFNRAGGYYWFKFQCFGWNDPDSGNKTPLGNKVSHQLSSTSCALNPSDQSRYVELHWKPSSTGTSQLLCTNYYQVPSAATSGVCSIRIDPPNPSITDTVYADVDIFTDDVLDLKVNGKGAAKNQTVATLKGKNNRVKLNTGSYAQGFGEGNYTVSLEGRTLNFNRCETDFFVSTQGGQVSSIEPTNICVFSNDSGSCEDCFRGGGSWSALGCIPADPQGFVKAVLGLGISTAGGIAFLLILFGAFQILTSSGNPERMNAGRELVTAAISGLLLIIFSVFLLRLIGFTILGIPGFGA